MMYPLNDGLPNTDRLYAWIARDLDGVEGIVTVPTELGMLPLVCTNRQQAEGYANVAAVAGRERDSTVRLVAFERFAQLYEIESIFTPTSASHSAAEPTP